MIYRCETEDEEAAVRVFVAASPEDLSSRRAFQRWRNAHPEGVVAEMGDSGYPLRSWMAERVPRRQRGRQKGSRSALALSEGPVTRKHFRITEGEYARLQEIGGGNATRGLRRLLRGG